MNVASILEKAYRLTNKNSSTFMDGNSANVLSEVNVCYGQRILDIHKVRQDINQSVTEQYATLKSAVGLAAGDIGYNGEYPFDTSTLRPLRVEISYDGLTWNKAKFYDLNDNPNSEFDDVNETFSQDQPYVRFEHNSYYVRPLKETAGDIVGGIRAWWEKRQTDLTTGYPDFEQNLHDILSYDMASLERIMHPDKYDINWRNDFDIQYAKVESRFNDYFKNRMKKNFVLKPNYESYK